MTFDADEEEDLDAALEPEVPNPALSRFRDNMALNMQARLEVPHLAAATNFSWDDSPLSA